MRKFIVLRTAGNFLLLLAVYSIVVTLSPIIIAQLQYKVQVEAGVNYEIEGAEIVRSYEETSSSPLNTLLKQGKPQKERIAPASTDFGIVIPKIGANSRVISNVKAGDENAYQEALMKGVAHAKNTAFPGEAVRSKFKVRGSRTNRKIYLFAHSTDNWWNVNRYNAVFFLLKELEKGDEINLYYKGRRHLYRAVESRIVEADEVGYLVEPSKEEVLVLQTCWPPGTTLKRLLVIAKPVSSLAGR